jgi:hypothetical protein
MSIPMRLWRVLRGHFIQVRQQTDRVVSEAEVQLARVRERTDAARAHADAARELGEDLASRRAREDAPAMTPDPRPRAKEAARPAAPSPGAGPRTGGRDPFAEDWALLQVAPGTDLALLEAAYQARLAETAPERFAEGSPERAGAERRKASIEAAYTRLRDTLNTTETRFEKLEF